MTRVADLISVSQLEEIFELKDRLPVEATEFVITLRLSCTPKLASQIAALLSEQFADCDGRTSVRAVR